MSVSSRIATPPSALGVGTSPARPITGKVAVRTAASITSRIRAERSRIASRSGPWGTRLTTLIVVSRSGGRPAQRWPIPSAPIGTGSPAPLGQIHDGTPAITAASMGCTPCVLQIGNGT